MKLRLPHKLALVFVVTFVVFGAGVAPRSGPAAKAQGGAVLTYGAITFGSITPQLPLQIYSFSGTQGDLVEVHMRTLSGGLAPFMDLLDPDRQTIASGRQDSLAAHTRDVQITLLLPQTGVYSLMIGGADNTTGDYTLELDGRDFTSRVPLTWGQALPVSVPLSAPPQYFSFVAGTCSTTLAVFNPSEGVPYTFPYIVIVRDERAEIVAVLRGGDTLEDRVTVPPQSGTYDVKVWGDDPAFLGTLTLMVTCADEAPACLSSAATGTEAVCPECPPCPSSEDPLCADFAVSFDTTEDGDLTISWTPVEGANAALVSLTDATGELYTARMVVDALSTTIHVTTFWGLGTEPYTARVTVGSEELGYDLCADSVVVSGEDFGPIPEPEPAECEIAIVAPRESIPNGLQTIFWTDVPGAESYRVRVYGQWDAVTADGTVSAPATSMTLDLSEAAIGAGYGGENDFYIQVNAYRGGESWCSNGVRVTRTMSAIGE